MSRWAIALFACGCTKPAAPPPAKPAEPVLFTVRADSLGPLTAKSFATLEYLRKALPGYDVVPVNSERLEYRVSLDGARLFDVIPDDDAHVLNVHVVSPKIEIAGRAWRVGAAFTDPEHVDTCECWADQTVCFKEGEHVAIGLAKICREGAFASASARRSLAGTAIRTAIWSPRPITAGGYGGDDHHGEEPGEGEPDPP